MKPKAKWEHERQDRLLAHEKRIWKACARQKSPRIVFEADLWKMLKNSTPWVWLEWIEFFSFFQHFSAFWKLMNAHFSKNSCYSRYSIINEWPHYVCALLKASVISLCFVMVGNGSWKLSKIKHGLSALDPNLKNSQKVCSGRILAKCLFCQRSVHLYPLM